MLYLTSDKFVVCASLVFNSLFQAFSTELFSPYMQSSHLVSLGMLLSISFTTFDSRGGRAGARYALNRGGHYESESARTPCVRRGLLSSLFTFINLIH